MNIRRFINNNSKLIGYIILVIIFGIFIIKALNAYYKEEEKTKANQIEIDKQNQENKDLTEEDYTMESDSIEITMGSFVNYCNKKEIEQAYKMLTDECKKAMFPTIEDFKKIYINTIYKTEREYELKKWSTDGNRYTYLVTLYGNIMATGNTEDYTQEYYTFIKDDNGNYKLNINNYIYGEYRNIEETINNITVKIGKVDVYDEYEEIEIMVTNNSTKTILLNRKKI